jgi:hypothetical protein
MLAKYSNLPVWLGDFRNTVPESRIETLRNVYDRISYERAEFSNDLRTRSTPIRGTLLLDGEETPRDPALQSRCAIILLSEYQRGTQETYCEVEAMSSSFSNFAFRVLSYGNVIAPRILEAIKAFLEPIAKVTSDQRLALNYAIVIASLVAMLETFEIELGDDREKFVYWVQEDALRNRELKISEDVVMRFFETLNVLSTKVVRADKYREYTVIERDRHFTVEGDKLYLWFSGAFSEYEADERRRGHTVFKQSVIWGYLNEEPYVIDISCVKRLGNKPQRCLVIDIPNAPEIAQTFAASEPRVYYEEDPSIENGVLP